MSSTYVWVKEFLFSIYVLVRVYCLVINRLIFDPKPYHGEYGHKIVLIGDGFALGFGGTLIPGLGGGIATALYLKLIDDRAIKQTWQIYNRGVYGSTSEDWLPSAESKRKVKAHLLETTVNEPKLADAEVYIVLVGSNDAGKQGDQISAEETVNNLKSICQFLRKKDKEVYLATIPTADASRKGEKFFENAKQCNDLIVQYLEEAAHGVKAAPRIDLDNIEYDRDDLYWSDGKHFNSVGYEKIAKDFLYNSKSDLIKLEFARFKKDLGY
ncbi:SGNH hydrolase [Basidiobolus meristosporus CBS 931.73]|uniref:SGNH hydrolase n=1 Tax=Basidiobolus meristosporus CBS 931.73 TaxID=1314790 RepID=A0A1Y1Y277_9FUNG|nr:SGNH hydrolase [Basidiobolus meristosporus CBS 931.73]|eukprot:ORX92121.1 SGNH hydrolase [Basidiobolus meristosporus CBS 931.73]